VKLPQLDQWNLQRREKARIYDELLSNVAGVTIPTEVTPAAPPALGHIYHQYTVRLDRRDNVQTAMHARGVQCVAYYPKCLHQQTVHADLPYGVGSFPVAEHAARTCLSLPMYPELDTDAQCYVAESLARCVAQFAVRQAG
jgi:dTDP-4-amino-4,6-dideoxygalactose transaminase